MAISKIKAMAKTLEKMETMRASVEEDVNKDIDEKRSEAFKAISDYMDEIADALDGTEVRFELTTPAAYKVFSDKDKRNKWIQVGFNSTYREKSDGYCRSTTRLKWWVAQVEDGRYSTYYGYRNKENTYRNRFIDRDMPLMKNWGEGDNRYQDGAINFIEVWSALKLEIEEGVERALKEKMDTACKAAEDRMTSYKIVEKFEV